jgi:thiamine pyrophosphokinase
MRAIIFANGPVPEGSLGRYPLTRKDWLIAADGGVRNCLDQGFEPGVVIGDLDSLSPEQEMEMRARGVEFVTHPARKDFTDLELAIRHAVEGGAMEIFILGALGARWDQSLANVLLPAMAPWAKVEIRLLHGDQELTVVHGGSRLDLAGAPGDIVSLLPLRGDVGEVVSQGLEYPLVEDTLHFGATRGVSNRMLGEEAWIRVGTGRLLCVIIHSDQSNDQEVRE